VEQNQSLKYTERTVGSAQFHGEHDFSKAKLDWVAAYNTTRQRDPDVRFFRNFFTMEFDGEDSYGTARQETQGVSREQNTRRTWRDVKEDGIQLALNAEMPFTQWTESEGKVKAGLFVQSTDRTYSEESMYYEWNSRQCCRGSSANINEEWIENNSRDRQTYTLEDFLAGGLWSDSFLDYIGIASNADSPGIPDHQLLWLAVPYGYNVPYTGDQSLEAAYAMAELPLVPKIVLVGGARIEKTEVSIDPTSSRLCSFTDDLGNQTLEPCVQVIELQESGNRAVVDAKVEDAAARIDDTKVLPALGINYEPIKNMKVRASWSRTIARPTFRELAPVATNEFLQGDEFVGNPDLEISSITNYDLRWEWFRRPGEVMAISLFYKELEDPIEYLGFTTGGRTFIQPTNFGQGTLQGIELEGRTSLDIFGKWGMDWTVGMNYSLIDSEVDVPPDEQLRLSGFGLDEPSRRLQGQPEHLFNIHVTYDSERRGLTGGLFFNHIGEILVTGAARGGPGANVEAGAVPNVFETANASLDFRLSKEILRKRDDLTASLSFKAKNLLQDDDETIYRTPDEFYLDPDTAELTLLEATKTLRATPLVISLSLNCKW
jgi:TonB-dependent receptor